MHCFFREALPFFCLLSDFVTVGALAKFALSATSHVSKQIFTSSPSPLPVNDITTVTFNKK